MDALAGSTLAIDSLVIDGHLLVRGVHVIAATLLVGGGVLAWAAWLDARSGAEGSRAALRLAIRYEWLAWGALGVLVATGVGNLGVFGEALPAPETRWGRALMVKLGLVLTLLLLSAVRVLALARLRVDAEGEAGDARMARAVRVVPRLYGVTALLGVGVVATAEVLAHG